MEQFLDLVYLIFPDYLIYGLIVLVVLIGFVKCVRPVRRGTSRLRRATDLLEEGAKVKLARPVFKDPNFLGKRLAPIWRAFLRSEELAHSRDLSCDVAEFINEDTMITDPGNASLADIVPGLCTSLGILGTFVGLYMGLLDLDINSIDSYLQLTSGISIAFMTSIVGLIASLLFNITNRITIGRARKALDTFYRVFYQHAVPQPPDAETQLVAYQREQADTLISFAMDLSRNIAGELQSSIAASMAPMQRSLEGFMNVATRAQIDGLDYVVARFIDRMSAALGGSLEKLGDMIDQTVEGQSRAQDEMLHTADAISQVAQTVVSVHGVSEQMINKFAAYVTTIEQHYRDIAAAQDDSADLLEEMGNAANRQADSFANLMEYQEQLTQSFHDYSSWTDKFVSGLEMRTEEQAEALSQTALEMRASAELLSGSYKGFVESIEVGLANALGLFDENMQNLTRQIQMTLSGIQKTMTRMEETIARVAPVLEDQRQEVG